MGQQLLPEGAAAATPATGYVSVYAKTDGIIYAKDDAGVETIVSGNATITGVSFTTGGTSTAYTLTPTPAIIAYAIGQEFDVMFNAECGATPTIAISGLAAVNLVDRLVDGTYYNIPSGRIPINWRSKCVMVSLTQMLVRDTPCESVTSTVLIASAVSLVSATAKTITSISIPAGNWVIFGNIALIPVAATVVVREIGSSSSTTNANGAEKTQVRMGFGASKTGQSAIDILTLPDNLISLTATTTYYLVADVEFGTSTMTAAGTIIANRYK